MAQVEGDLAVGTKAGGAQGVGARLGVNVGYLKFTPAATWNPF